MDLTAVARIALALDGVRETTHRGLRQWRMDGRLVAREVDAQTLVIRSGFGEREMLVDAHPETFSVSPRYESHMMVLADLARGEDAAIQAAIEAAWSLQRNAAT